MLGCDISDFHTGVVVDSGLLGCNIVSMDLYFPDVRKAQTASFSKLEEVSKNFYF